MEPIINRSFEKEVQALQSFLVEVRRHIHAHPEIGTDQPNTVRYLAEQFKDMDVKLHFGGEHVGLVVDIQGAMPGPSLGFRADMDALEMSETSNPDHIPNRLGFCSTVNNHMHACGHDAHSAILAGLGKLVYAHRDQLKGRVRLLFQPGEEGFYGAVRMVKKGYLDDLDAVFALHCHSNLKTGQIAYRPGSIMAAVDAYIVKIKGIGGHGASPHHASDQVLALCRTVENLQSIVSRRLNPLASAVVSTCYLRAGGKDMKAIIPAEVEFGGTVRTLDADVRAFIQKEFLTMCESSVQSVHPHCHVEMDYHAGYDETVNDPDTVARLTTIFSRYMDKEDLMTDFPPLLGSEDFSAMLKKVPGAMFFLGVTPRKTDSGNIAFLHNPEFDIDETALGFGVQAFANIVFNF